MTDENKMIWMFVQVHGLITSGPCYLEYENKIDQEGNETPTLSVMKDGNLCWSVTKIDLVFDYLTKDLE